MRLCYLVSEYFRWGRTGGYGAIARSVAEGLAARGHEVSALVPKRTAEAKREQPEVEVIEGVRVFALPHSYLARLARPALYRRVGAELFVSVDARFDSWRAMRACPRARHAIWLVDPMRFETYWRLHREDPAAARSFEKLATRAVFETLQHFGRRAVRRADALLSQPRALARSAPGFFGLEGARVHVAPNPVVVPGNPIEKAERPLALFLGRFDWQKQPERFFALAQRLPEVDFVAAGAASDARRDRALRERFAGRLPNLELPGVVSGDAKDALLRRAWILCNTSLREGLPMSFLEALAHECAIVAAVDPDELVSRFGYHAADRDFERGLRALLEAERWRELGRAGRRYVGETHEREQALDVHEALYERILDRGPG